MRSEDEMVDKFEHYDAANYFCVDPSDKCGGFWVEAGSTQKDAEIAYVSNETLAGLYDWITEALGEQRGPGSQDRVQWSDPEPVKSAWTPAEWDSWYEETTKVPEREVSEFHEVGTATVYLTVEGGEIEASMHEPAHTDCYGTFEVSLDRKSTRLNSSHVAISYAVFCLKKKNT